MNRRWSTVIAGWVLAAVAALVFGGNMDDLTRDDDAFALPAGSAGRLVEQATSGHAQGPAADDNGALVVVAPPAG